MKFRLFFALLFIFGFLNLSGNISYLPYNDSLSFTVQHYFDNHVVLLTNPQELIPLKQYKNLRQLNIISGEGFSSNQLTERWEWYGKSDTIRIGNRPDYREITEILDTLTNYDQIFLHLAPTDGLFAQQLLNLPDLIKDKSKVVLIIYDHEGLLERMQETDQFAAVIYGINSQQEAMTAVVKAVFGGIPFSGVNAKGEGLQTLRIRINYCSSWESGIDPGSFAAIDSIVADAIAKGAFPGCQVLAIWKGNLIFEKSYGHHTWKTEREVQPTDIYDLASLTKILTTTPALIQLYHSGVIDIDEKLGKYLSIASGSNKEDLRIKEILSHRARLQSWIPFYRQLMTGVVADTTIFSKAESFEFPVQVCDSLYIQSSYTDTMVQLILNSPLRKKHTYLYSDLGMILLKFAIEEQTKLPFEEYLENEIYNPLNLCSTGFNPYRYFSRDRIVPTEDDRYFRNALVHGFVHDPAAAMMGGVAGHAGLFANARDVGVLMYTLMNNGRYGGVELFDPSAIDEFNKKHYYRLRRGLGFDKPEVGKPAKPNVTHHASQSSFGHSGFTGTFTWADPENELVYVFLSNRVHPSGENPLLTRLGVRIKIHEELYMITRKVTAD